MSNGLLFKVDIGMYDIVIERINVINGDLLTSKKMNSKVFDEKIEFLKSAIQSEKPDKIIFDKAGIGKGFYELFVKKMSDGEFNFEVDSYGTTTYDVKQFKEGLTEIVFILDKSGSMHTIKDDAIGGFNSFVEEQLKNEGETNVNLVLFDTYVSVRNNITKIDDNTYKPSGMTALLDAIGAGIANMESKLAETPKSERPENIVFTIMTDGEENSSREYSKSAIEKLIKEKTELGWQFIFMGANIDSVSTAKGLGIDSRYAGDFVAVDGMGMKAMLNASEIITTYRQTGEMKEYSVDVKIDVKEPSDDLSQIAKMVTKTMKEKRGLR